MSRRRNRKWRPRVMVEPPKPEPPKPKEPDPPPPPKRLPGCGWFVLAGQYPYTVACLIVKEFHRADLEAEAVPYHFSGYYEVHWRKPGGVRLKEVESGR